MQFMQPYFLWNTVYLHELHTVASMSTWQFFKGCTIDILTDTSNYDLTNKTEKQCMVQLMHYQMELESGFHTSRVLILKKWHRYGEFHVSISVECTGKSWIGNLDRFSFRLIVVHSCDHLTHSHTTPSVQGLNILA